VTDFLVADATQFSTKLLQGVPIRAMFSFDEHTKPTKNEFKEDLQLLSEIWDYNYDIIKLIRI
jgi:hypothetical protein